MNYIYDLPKWAAKLGWNHAARALLEGWQFAHLLAFFSGLPYSPSFSIQQANTGSTINLQQVFMGTPDITPRLAINGSLSPTANRLYFNPSKLGVPAIFPSANGTGSRNFLTAPGTFANDMSLTKRFRNAEGKSLEFRVNAYNVFNQVRRVSLNSPCSTKPMAPIMRAVSRYTICRTNWPSVRSRLESRIPLRYTTNIEAAWDTQI
jgi:hypothetical protein